jgi:hypothetical protein
LRDRLRDWRGRWCGLRDWSRRWCGRGLNTCPTCCSDNCNHSANWNCVAFFDANLCERASDWRWNFGVNFVCRNFEQRLVGGNCIANFFEPTSNRSFCNCFSELWKRDVSHLVAL